MRILRLDLLAFGPFTDARLELADEQPGLHLIYGPNEAGKSTALRALIDLLYGIPANSADNFVHPYPKLRIGGLLGRSDGTRLEIVRRKGNKRTLLGADGSTPLGDDALRGFLAGIDRDQFVTMFGIGHESLVRGGAEIISGQGEVGATLFAAGAGIAGLRELRDELQKEADALFTPRGSKPALNQRLAELREARKQLRQAQLPSRAWQRHDEALREAQAKLARVEEELQHARQRHSHLERIAKALPVVGSWRAVKTELDGLGEVPELSPDFAEQRRDTQSQRAAARKQQAALAEELRQLEQQIVRIPPPQTVLEYGEAIRGTHQRLSVHRKALADLPALEANRRQLADQAQSVLAAMHPDLEIDAAESLRISRQQQVAVQSLGNRHEAFRAQQQQSADEAETLARQLEENERAQGELPEARDTAALKDALARALREGDLDARLSEAHIELDRLQQQAAAELARLPHFEGDLPSLAKLPVPEAETCDRFEAELDAARRAAASAKEALDEANRRQDELAEELDRLTREGDVPSEEALAEARRLRDAGWRLIRRGYQGEEPPAAEVGAWLSETENQDDLLAAYEQAVLSSDQLADRLHREAKRVADRATLAAELQANRKRIEQRKQAHSQGEADLQRLREAWTACWKPAGIRPEGPREMRAWLARWHDLLEHEESIGRQRAALALVEQRLAAHREELRREMQQLGESSSEEPGDDSLLGAVCGRAQSLLDRVEANRRRREQLAHEAAALRTRRDAAEAAAAKAAEALADWSSRWAAAIEPLRLPPDASPEQAVAAMAQTEELFDRLDQCRGFDERIEGIRRDAKQFADDVATLCAKIDPSLGEQPAEAAAEALVQRLAEADDAQRRREMLDAQREQLQAKQKRQDELIDALDARLETLCREAGCAAADQLPEIERLSARAAELRRQLRASEDELGRLAGGGTPEELIAETDQADVDELPGLIERVAREIEQYEADRLRLSEEVGTEREALRAMGTGGDAADLAQQIEQLLAEIALDVQQFARLRMAACVLRDGIERYRQSSEGPVLRRASELFTRLTLGGFNGLRIDVDERGENVLAGIRAGGEEIVRPSGMSDGTCDQLYLALRLASLEHYLDRNEPMPFIVDDILISFDDARAAAALEVLSELAQQTQVIFFSHHEHLVELARERIDANRVSFHELPRRTADVTSPS